MKHSTLEEVSKVAKIALVEQEKDARSTRRQRLERLAFLLDAHKGGIRLFSMMEYAPPKQRMKMRQGDLPLAVAYQDAQFREQGLESDLLGDAMKFFDLSMGEAHHLLCDCHYVGSITPGMVATRARALAQKTTFAETWQNLRQRLSRWVEQRRAW